MFWQKNFLYLSKNKIIYNFMLFVATKNGWTKKLFSPASFGAVVGSGMDKNQDPGSGISRIRNTKSAPFYLMVQCRRPCSTWRSTTWPGSTTGPTFSTSSQVSRIFSIVFCHLGY
jgi:hypothetical protein